MTHQRNANSLILITYPNRRVVPSFVALVYEEVCEFYVGKPQTPRKPLYVRSSGSSLPTRTSITGTCSSSLRIEATLGIAIQRTRTMRCNQAEVVALRSEADRANPSINSPVRKQSHNPRVVSGGKAEGSDSSAERCDKPKSLRMVNLSRAVNDVRCWSTTEPGGGPATTKSWMAR